MELSFLATLGTTRKRRRTGLRRRLRHRASRGSFVYRGGRKYYRSPIAFGRHSKHIIIHRCWGLAFLTFDNIGLYRPCDIWDRSVFLFQFLRGRRDLHVVRDAVVEEDLCRRRLRSEVRPSGEIRHAHREDSLKLTETILNVFRYGEKVYLFTFLQC